MNLRRILSLAQSGALLPYALGRFATVRRLYSRLNGLRHPLDRRESLAALQDPIFPQVDVSRAVQELRRDAVAFQFDLPTPIVEEIHDFARRGQCKSSGFQGHRPFPAIASGQTSEGQRLAMAEVINPLECDAIRRIVESQALRQTCMRYLGYQPPKADIRLFWSFVSNLSENERRQQFQTIDYHVDIHDFNFCYAHFYLTDTDARSGAHVMVRGSHTYKPLAWLIGSARKSDAQIASRYASDDVLTIEGPAGTGFLEDTSCYHKALPPLDRMRLLLQIRYH
jgi:hypothetical protein